MLVPPDVSILVLTYTRSDLLHERLAEIARHCRGDFEVVVGDNDSPNRQASLVASSFVLDGSLKIRTARMSPNVGFGRAFNMMLALADGRHCVCLSDDVQVSADLIAPLMEAFASSPDGLICHRVIDWAAGWNQFGDLPPITYPEGYFLAASADTWKRLGYFDPRFHPNDYEDLDLGYNAKNLDIPVVPWPALPLRHMSAQTVGHSVERMAQTNAMRALFAEKWGLPNIPEKL